MLKSLKLLILGLGVFLMIGGGSLLFAQTGKSSDPVEQRVEELQKMIDERGYHWKAGRNWTSDLTDEEFARLLGFKPPKGYYEWLEKQPKLKAKPGMDFPPVFDWRDSSIVTPVKNQASCGSCWDFAATGAFEAAVKHHDGIEYDLSEQQVMSCNLYESGCGGGWAEPVYELFQRYGAVLESCMPYQAVDGVPCTQDECEVVAKLKDWVYVENDVNAIKTALLTGPVYSGFSVYQDFSYYTSGCYQYSWGNYRGGHLIVIVGWDDTLCDGAWICKNSWDTDWGDLGGFFYIKWEDCGIGRSTVLPLYPPDPVNLAYEDHQVFEASGDGDGIAEPGETITLSVDLKNTGPDTATSVQATLLTTIPGINITDAVAIFPDIPSGQILTSESPHFTIEIDSAVERASRIDFDLSITCDQGTFSGSLYDFAGEFDTTFFDDMEGGDNGWTHSGTLDEWEHGSPQVGSRTDPLSAHSGTKIWGNDLNGNYEDEADNYLVSPVINCRNMEKTRLWFSRWLAVEKAIYDNADIYVNDNLVWSNDYDYDQLDFKWHHHDIDISPYADSQDSVRIKFVLKSDEGLHLGGWNIDDLSIVGIFSYMLGDVNNDQQLSVSDVIYLINYLFKGGQAPVPLDAGNANCDEDINVSDVIYLINYLFKGGPAPGC